MIGKLKGIIDSYGEDFIVLDVQGVGYLVHCSARTLQALPAAGEVLATHVIPKMTQRVLVENWPAEKAVEEAHKAIAEIYARHAKG